MNSSGIQVLREGERGFTARGEGIGIWLSQGHLKEMCLYGECCGEEEVTSEITNSKEKT